MTEQINKDYLKEKQYKTTQYLEARIKIHSFTENKQSFHQWLYDQYDFSNFKDKKIKVLDVACGTGVFWKQNFDKFKDFVFFIKNKIKKKKLLYFQHKKLHITVNSVTELVEAKKNIHHLKQ